MRQLLPWARSWRISKMGMRLDHIELLVPDRDAAVAWYAQWLEFEVMPEHADWVETGPQMMTNDGGSTKLALFARAGSAGQSERGWRRVAFRTDAESFWEFARRYRESGQAIEGPVDHGKAWSVYFRDPWGNPLEMTTYDYAAVAMIVDD